jgi:ribosome-binding factor A
VTARDRPARVAHELQRALSDLIARGLKDPRVTGLVTVTGAKISPDLREAVAYVSVHGEEKVRRQTLAGLRAAAGWLQREASHALGLRFTPHLRFEYDASVEQGDRIERLLREVKEKEGWK